MINIRKIGCNGTHDTDFYIDRPNGYDCYLLLMVKTPAAFYINHKEILTSPDTMILYTPGTPHCYRANSEIYVNDWMQFCADDALIEGLNIPLNTLISIGGHSNLYTLFQLISESFYSEQEHEELVTYYLANALLYSISNISATYSNSRFKELVRLRCDIYSNPSSDWSIASISERLNISQGYLQYQYKEAFGITCQKDVERSRMEHACRLLTSTNLTVKQISYECGYQNSEHFMRKFKFNMKDTPSEYRDKHP